MSDIYAFQNVVIDFVERTPWIEAAFPFGKFGLSRRELVTGHLFRGDA